MENKIKYESENFYIYQQGENYEIRCHSKDKSHSVVTGKKDNIDDAIKTIKRLEPYIDEYREFANI